MAQQVVREVIIRGKTEGMDGVRASLDQVTQAQDRLAASSGKMTQASTSASRGAVSYAGGQLDVSRSLDRHLRQVDDVYRSESNLATKRAVFDRALSQGKLTVDQHAAALEKAAQKYKIAGQANDNFGKSTEVAAHHIQNLTYQISDVATSLAGGASPFMVMSQQAGQILPILTETGVSGAIKGIGTRLSALVPLSVGVFGSMAAGIGSVAYAYSQYNEQTRQQQRRLMGVGRGSGLTPEDLRIASGEKQAGTRGYSPGVGGLSLANSRELATGIGGTGFGSVEGIRQAAGMVKDLSVTLGQSQSDVAESMVELFRDPSKQLDQWNQRLGFATGSLRDYVKTLQDQGQNGRAAQEVMTAMQSSLGKYAEMTPGTARAVDTLTRALSDLWSGFERGSKVLIDGPESLKRTGDAAKAAADRAAEEVRRIRDTSELATNAMRRDNILAGRNPLAQAT